ncbi:MAG: response regulator transcription factor [Sulfuricella sp.]
MIKILVADDHALVREGLKQIIGNAQNIAVVGEAVSGWEVLEKVHQIACNVLLLDVSMPGISGVDLIKRVKEEKPALPILVLSIYNEGQLASRALKAGAAGYVTKGSDPELLLTAIRKVAAGGRFVDPMLAEQMVLEFSLSDTRPLYEQLSEREFQVLQQVLSGKHISEIALELSLSAKTISTHKARLMRKLNVQNNADLIRYGMDHSLLERHQSRSAGV